jgi:hypothetical protein
MATIEPPTFPNEKAEIFVNGEKVGEGLEGMLAALPRLLEEEYMSSPKLEIERRMDRMEEAIVALAAAVAVQEESYEDIQGKVDDILRGDGNASEESATA